MTFATKTFRWIARCLLAAVLLQALAPAWASIRGNSDESMLEVCTVVGTKWIKQGVDKNVPSSLGQHDSSNHCIFCASTGASDPFDASELLVNHTSSVGRLEPALPFVRMFSGHIIQSRAPPL